MDRKGSNEMKTMTIDANLNTTLFRLTLVAALLSGCGGGGEDDATASLAAQAEPGAAALSMTAVSGSDLVFDPSAAGPVSAGPEPSRLTGAGNSHVAIDASGRGVMFYVSDRVDFEGVVKPGLFARTLDSSGQLSEERSFSSNGLVKDLRIKFARDGKDAAIVWVEKSQAGAGGSSSIKQAHYSHGGFYGPETISIPPPVAGEYTERERPDVAMAPDNESGAVVWTERTKGLNGAPDRFRTMTATLQDRGGVAWETTRTIRELGTEQRDHAARIAMLPDNSRVVVVAQQTLPGTARRLVFYRSAGPNQPWGPGNLLPNPSYELQNMPAGSVLDVDLAANTAGQVTVVWRHSFPSLNGRTAVFATRLLPSGAWTDPVLVDRGAPASEAEPSVGVDSTDPRVVVDAEGNALFAWRQQDAVGSDVYSLYAARLNSATGTFDSRPVLLESRSNLTIGAPALTLNPDGQGLISWVQDTSDGGPLSFSLFARRLDGGGKAFGAVALVEAATANVVGTSPGVAIAPDGRALALWQQNGRVMFNRSQPLAAGGLSRRQAE
jgi:hypothetical protein